MTNKSHTIEPLLLLESQDIPEDYFEPLMAETAQLVSTSPFASWPPKTNDENRYTPTASPLYIPPPETQHIVSKPFYRTEHAQNYSAPELSSMTLKESEQSGESGSESLTSTSTTTTATSEESQYQRCYQMHMMHNVEPSYSDIDIQEVDNIASMQQYKMSICSAEVNSFTGRRSAQECALALGDTISNQYLIDTIREQSPRPRSPIPKLTKRVEFTEPLEREDQSYDFGGQCGDGKTDYIAEVKCQSKSYMPVDVPHVPNSVPKEWSSAMCQALTTASTEEFHSLETSCSQNEVCEQLCVKSEAYNPQPTPYIEVRKPFEYSEVIPAKGYLMASILATAPSVPIEFNRPVSCDPIELPEETEAYNPPQTFLKPARRDEIFGTKSPMLSALITAPDRPYTPFTETDVITQLDDLPTPTEKLTMLSALVTAPKRAYTPLGAEIVASSPSDEAESPEPETLEPSEIHHHLKYEETSDDIKECFKQISTRLEESEKTIESEMSHQLSAFANVSGVRSVHMFKPCIDPVPSFPKGFIPFSEPIMQSYNPKNQTTYQTTCQLDCQTSSSMSQTHSESHIQSSSQSMHEIDENLHTEAINYQKPARFAGLHEPNSIPKYQKQWFNLPTQRPVKTPEPPELKENVPLAFLDVPKQASPTIAKPVAVTGSQTQTTTIQTQSYIENQQLKQNAVNQFKFSPMIEPRSEPITMSFQSLDFDENQPTEFQRPVTPSRPYTPSMINKPAPIIPKYQQNLIPLDMGLTETNVFDPLVRPLTPNLPENKSPAPGPPPNPLKSIMAPRIKEEQPQQHKQSFPLIPNPMQSSPINYQMMSQSGATSFYQSPEMIQQKQIGDTRIQTRSQESKLNEEKRKEMQSATTTQVGNTQIQKRTRVVEEFEHTQSAKSIEILKTSGSQKLTSSSSNQLQGQIQNKSQFNSQSQCQSQTQNQAQCQVQCQVQCQAPNRRVSDADSVSSVSNKIQSLESNIAKSQGRRDSGFPQSADINQPSAFPIKRFHLPTEQEFLEVRSKSPIRTESCAPPPGFKPKIIKINNSLTKSVFENTQQQQQQLQSTKLTTTSSSSAPKLTTAVPVPAFKPPMQTANDFKPNQNKPAYIPTPSTSGPGFKPPNTNPSVVTPASAGPNKGGAFGAIGAPKRGRGVMNKAVGPGSRVPTCGCCNSQIR